MELRRTAVVKLDVDDDAHHLLDETIDRFKQTAQMVVDDGYIITSKPNPNQSRDGTIAAR